MGSAYETEDEYDTLNKSRHVLSDEIKNQANTPTLFDILKQYKKTQTFNEFIKIEEPSHVKLILESYGDSHSRKILETAIDTPRTIMELLKLCDMPQTSLYRKIIFLIEKGLLAPCEFTTRHGRRVMSYKSTFKSTTIEINKNVVSVKVKLP